SRDRLPRGGRAAGAGLVAPAARRARRRLGRGGRRALAPRPARPAPARALGARRRPQPALLPAAAPALAARRPRAGRARGAAGLHGRRRAVRGAGGRQTSTAIRSSTRVKTSAPTASEATAATAR